jgi:hypothetical protein
MSLGKVADGVIEPRDRRAKATRRELLGGATALAATPNAIPACNDPITDPIIALLAEERH